MRLGNVCTRGSLQPIREDKCKSTNIKRNSFELVGEGNPDLNGLTTLTVLKSAIVR